MTVRQVTFNKDKGSRFPDLSVYHPANLTSIFNQETTQLQRLQAANQELTTENKRLKKILFAIIDG